MSTNPLIAPPHHSVLVNALERSTEALKVAKGTNRDVQSLTGPGNLTAALVEHVSGLANAVSERDFFLLRNWDETAVSKWPLDYRSDSRNWRNWVKEQ